MICLFWLEKIRFGGSHLFTTTVMFLVSNLATNEPNNIGNIMARMSPIKRYSENDHSWPIWWNITPDKKRADFEASTRGLSLVSIKVVI